MAERRLTSASRGSARNSEKTLRIRPALLELEARNQPAAHHGLAVANDLQSDFMSPGLAKRFDTIERTTSDSGTPAQFQAGAIGRLSAFVEQLAVTAEQLSISTMNSFAPMLGISLETIPVISFVNFGSFPSFNIAIESAINESTANLSVTMTDPASSTVSTVTAVRYDTAAAQPTTPAAVASNLSAQAKSQPPTAADTGDKSAPSSGTKSGGQTKNAPATPSATSTPAAATTPISVVAAATTTPLVLVFQPPVPTGGGPTGGVGTAAPATVAVPAGAAYSPPAVTPVGYTAGGSILDVVAEPVAQPAAAAPAAAGDGAPAAPPAAIVKTASTEPQNLGARLDTWLIALAAAAYGAWHWRHRRSGAVRNPEVEIADPEVA
jgi:hypothetical protein